MKIAIPADDKSIDARMDQRFGRTRFFLIYETENDEYEFITNEQNVFARQGAGIQSAQAVTKKKVQAVIAVNVGPKAFEVLAAANIPVYHSEPGKLKDIIDEFKKGNLIKITGANKMGHW